MCSTIKVLENEEWVYLIRADRSARLLFISWFPYVRFFFPGPHCVLDMNHFLSQSQQHLEVSRGRASGFAFPMRPRKYLSLLQRWDKSAAQQGSAGSRAEAVKTGLLCGVMGFVPAGPGSSRPAAVIARGQKLPDLGFVFSSWKS